MSKDYIMEIDMIPFVVEAIISNSKIENKINSLYKKHKYKAYELAKNNKFYNHQILSDGGIKREVYAKRALGLILLTKENEKVCDEMKNIVIGGWNKLHDYCHREVIVDLEEIVNRFTYPSLSDDEFNAILTFSLVFAKEYGKPVTPEYYLDKITYSYAMRLWHYEENLYRFSYKNLKNNKKLFEKGKKIKDRFFNNFGHIKHAHDLYHSNNEDLNRYTDHVNMIFDSEDMMFASMLSDDVLIDEKDIIELAALYFLMAGNQNKEESAKFIIFGLYLKYTIKAYKDVKDFYFENNQETMYYQLEKQDKHTIALEEENNSLKAQLEAQKTVIKRLKTEYKNSIEKENILLHREIRKLKREIDEINKDKKELLALRDTVLKVEKDEVSSTSNDIAIPPINAIIAGGHNNWHNKLKELLPNTFKYLEGDNNNFDTNILNNIDYVFIYTNYMGHSFYYKLINKCKNIDANIYYINSTSPGYVKKEIFNLINK